MLPSLPAHTWRYSVVDGLRHQYSVNAEPDGEGVLTAACDRLAFHDRVHPAGAASEPHCPDCLIAAMADEAVQVEHAHRRQARIQQDELQDGTFNV